MKKSTGLPQRKQMAMGQGCYATGGLVGPARGTSMRVPAPVGAPPRPVPTPNLGGGMPMRPPEVAKRNNGVPGMKTGGHVTPKQIAAIKARGNKK